MKIKSVHIKNFLTIGEAKLSLDQRGLLLIQGENRDDTSADSNGAGKSSVVDAISWGLYGVTARGVTGDAVVNLKAGKGAHVQIELEDGPDTYRVNRMRKGSGLTVHHEAGGVETELTKGTEKETQEVIERIMGCSLEVFLAAVYAGQEAMPDLPGMTDKHLKVLIEEAAGVEVLNRAYEIARTRAADAKTDVAKKDAELVKVLNQIENLKSWVEDQEKSLVEWEERQAEKIDACTKMARHHMEQCKSIQAQVALMPKAEIEREITEGRTKLDGLNSEKEKLMMLAATVQSAGAKFAQAMANVDTWKKRVVANENSMTNIDSRVGTPCKECGKPYHTHDLDQARSLLTTQAENDKRSLVEAAQQAKVLKVALDKAQEDRDTFAASMTDSTVLTNRMMELSKKLSEITQLENQAKHRIESSQQQVNAIKALKTEVNPHKAKLEKYKADLKTTEGELEIRQKQLEDAKQRLALAEEAVHIFGPSGVRAHILDTVTPFLNDKTSEYLGALSDGAITALWSTLTKTAKGDTREKFNIEVANSKGANSFAGLSGGEKRKVRLACALALQDLVATRATKPIEIFIADEVDHALDESGLERLMSVLETKARERGTVLVISHNSLSDWIDNVVTVVKESGISRVEGALA